MGWGYVFRYISNFLNKIIDSKDYDNDVIDKIYQIYNTLCQAPVTEEYNLSTSRDLQHIVLNSDFGVIYSNILKMIINLHANKYKKYKKEFNERMLNFSLLKDDKGTIYKAVIGLFLPWLNSYETKWLEKNLDELLPERNDKLGCFYATISGYINYRQADLNLLKLIKNKMVHLIAIHNGDDNSIHIENFVYNLYYYFYTGTIAVKDDDVLKTILDNKKVADSFIGYISRRFFKKDSNLDKKEIKKIMEIFDYIFSLIEENKLNDYSEFNSFGYCYTSDFMTDRKWALDKSITLYNNGIGFNSVLIKFYEQLTKDYDNYKNEVIELLKLHLAPEKKVEVNQGYLKNTRFYSYQEEYKLIFDKICDDKNNLSKENKEDLIYTLNRLGELGYSKEFEVYYDRLISTD